MRINPEGIKANAQYVAGALIGLCVLRPLGLRFGKEHRGRHVLFCHVAANLAADLPREAFRLPFAMIRK